MLQFSIKTIQKGLQKFLKATYYENMSKIIPIASGKGGVGKSTLTANLALLLSQLGQKVLAVDLDLGASNLHTYLGVKNSGEGISALIQKRVSSLAELIQETPYPNLHIIQGDGLIPGTANLSFFAKKKIVKGLLGLPYDVILVDLSAGTSANTLDFFLVSNLGLLVTLPETTAVLNAYAFVKNALFRLLALRFPPRSDARKLVEEFSQQRLEGSGQTIGNLIEDLHKISPEIGLKAQEAWQNFKPAVVVNSGRSAEDMELGNQLRRVCMKNLECDLTYLAFIPHEENARAAQNQRIPLIQFPTQPMFAQSLGTLAQLMASATGRDDSDMIYWEGSETLEDLSVDNTKAQAQDDSDEVEDEEESEDSETF